MEASTLQRRFSDALDEARVIAEPDVLSAYAADMTECEPAAPELVVKPTSVEEVQAVVRLAAADGIPLTPAVARTNVGGLAIPTRGGVVVDLSEMNRVVELDRDHMIAIIEPGVTFAQMKDLLDREAPELTLSYPLSPIYASVLANFLLDRAGEPVGAPRGQRRADRRLEAVLPDGSLVRTGMGVVSEHWLSRAPLPRPDRPVPQLAGDLRDRDQARRPAVAATRLTRRLFIATGDMAARSPSCASWPARRCAATSADLVARGQVLFGVERPLMRAPGDPEFFVYADLGGEDEDELRWREGRVDAALSRAAAGGLRVVGKLSIEDLIAVAPTFGRFADFPMTLDFLLDHPGGGLTWVGTMGRRRAGRRARPAARRSWSSAATRH